MASCGIDIGTCFLVSAKQDDNREVLLKSIRDAFIDMDNDPQVTNMLKMSKVDFIESDDKLYVIGDSAVVMANIFKKEARRPLSRGIISPGELEAEKILLILIENILGKCAAEKKETCYFSVPAPPIENVDADVVYHQAMFSKLVGSLGYEPVALNEAAAIVYSNCAKEQFSAIGISCLPPGQKVITKRGFVNIENILERDEILTKDGLWKKCVPTNRDYKGDIFHIKAYGNGSVKVTADHKIWICRDSEWQWIEAKNVKIGDLVKQPWVNHNFNKSRYLFWDERITSSKKTHKKICELTSDMAELIGYFLGDGHADYTHNGQISFTISSKDIYNIDRIEFLVDEVFDKRVSIYDHNEGAKRLTFFSKGFSKWLRENCYNKQKEKIVPWDVSCLSDNILRFLLKGLFESDGYFVIGSNSMSFSNTSPNLASFVYLSLLRLGLCPHFFCGDARIGGIVDGDRVIQGKKESFEIGASGFDAQKLIEWIRNPVRTAKKSYNHGCTVASVNCIEKESYEGKVYDVSVEGNDHSFCTPGFAIHNCGAGMTNVCLMYQTMIGMAFSIGRGGDFIDQSAARATGSTASRIMSIKEKGINLLDPHEGDPKTFREREAIIIYYKSLVLYALDCIKNEFLKRQSTIELPGSIPIILSGGTSLATNFKEFFETGFATVKKDFPISVSEIRMATDPLNSVAQGLLVAAMNYDEGQKA